MQFTIVTGLSGSGKTQVMKFLEDAGFFCIDNLPPVIIPQLAAMFISINGKYEKVAFAIDSRVGDMISDLLDNLKILKENGYDYKLVFVDASDDVLVKRYKETRRHHPIASKLGLLGSIKKEREMLSKIYQEADEVIDTSKYTLEQLSKALRKIYSGEQAGEFSIDIMSFGFKYGIPLDADLVFDVRCFVNPFYVDELKDKTGNDEDVREYIMSTKTAKKFMEKLISMIKFLLPLYIEEGKTSLTIAIGCTGGKHRSVTMANVLSEELEGYNKNLIHRDISRGR